MTIRSVVIHVRDVQRSVDFYTRFLDLRVLRQSETEAELDAVAATLLLVQLPQSSDSTFVADDLQAGFRHIGFKVSDLAARVARLKDAGVVFHLDPIHAEGDVDLTFFYDPDGTLLEFVQGALQYHEVHDRAAVDADWALGDPDRPRFDHIAETVRSLTSTAEFYAGLGFRRMAGIHQPGDSRGYEIDFLRDGDVSLEIFTFSGAEKTSRSPQSDALGFAAVRFDGAIPTTAEPVGRVAGRPAFVDPDGLVLVEEDA